MPDITNTSSISVNGGPAITSNSVTTTFAALIPPTITKSVNLINAIVGDTLTYTIVITNLNPLTTLSSVLFTDVIPAQCEYVTGSFKVNDIVTTPTTTTPNLTYTIPTISALGIMTVQFSVNIVE